MIQQKLRNYRKQKGFSQEQMAKILSTDPSNYSRKERGEVKIHEEEWEKLSNALDIPVEDLKELDKYSFRYENSTFHDHSGSNINYYNVPDFFVETQKRYIAKLEEENQRLKEEIDALKSPHNLS